MNAEALRLRLHWILRVSAGLCFIGHGAFGVLTKEAWLHFYAPFGIPAETAYMTQPIIGGIDILLGLWVLYRPNPAVLLYMTFWAVWTALLRPIAGQSWFEVWERGGNYGAPLTLLLLAAHPARLRDYFSPLGDAPFDPPRAARIALHLRLYTFLLLLGHGGYCAFLRKTMLADHFASVGLPFGALHPKEFLLYVGWFEIVLAALAAARPSAPLFLFVACWKFGQELLYPISGDYVWEFVERWGSYGVPLAGAVLYHARPGLGAPAAATSVRKGRTALVSAAVVAVPILAFPFLPQAAVSMAETMGGWALDLHQPKRKVEILARGGYVVFFRHTSRRSDAFPTKIAEAEVLHPLDLRGLCADGSELSEKGRREAEAIRDTIRAKRIPVGEAYASPTCRTLEMAEILFGAGGYETSPAIVYFYLREPDRHMELNGELRRLLGTAPPEGTNRFLISHNRLLNAHTIGYPIDLAHGDAAVFRPRGPGEDGRPRFDFVGVIQKKEWGG